MHKLAKVSAAVSTAFLATTVHATSVLPAGLATTLQTDGTDTMTEIGGALLSIAIVAVLFKWAKGALFG